MTQVFIIVPTCYHRNYMDATNGLFYIVILIMSVVIHEVSHGFMAEYFGDKTARYAGRLTLNPLKHLDLFGSVLLPAILVISNTPFLFGWAKPVPYNPDNLSNRKWGTIAVAAAGVLANFSIAILFGIIIRLTSGLAMPADFSFLPSSFSRAMVFLEQYSFFFIIIFIIYFSGFLFPILSYSFSLLTSLAF